MGESYKRRCVYCGEWIQMRQMPQGQWVPFDDFNTVHKCDREFAVFERNSQSKSNSDFQPKRRNYEFQPKMVTTTNRADSDSSGCVGILIVVIIIAILDLLF